MKDWTEEQWAVFAYSEWLDQNGLLVDEGEYARTHEDLVNEFYEQKDEE